jgi:GTP diphosphokinase / guanosine-3',5'-bis(diphosphate) 3'-diphosphatase
VIGRGLFAATSHSHDDPVAELLHIVVARRPGADVQAIRKAYNVAEHWHRGQKRRSGDPYIVHPLAVATILADLGADDDTLCAALLHDTVDDTPYTLAALRDEFGAEIARLVQGVATLDKVKLGLDSHSDAAAVMAAALPDDIRIPQIKFVDRLHSMRTVR